MTLPAGTIYMSQVNTELGRSSTAYLTLNDAEVRLLAQRPSGIIYMSDLHNKTATTYTLTAQLWTTLGFTLGIGANVSSAVGSISPATWKGISIEAMIDSTNAQFYIGVYGTYAKSTFYAMTINGHTLYSAAATHEYSGNGTQWRWSPIVGLVNGGVYTVKIFG